MEEKLAPKRAFAPTYKPLNPKALNAGSIPKHSMGQARDIDSDCGAPIPKAGTYPESPIPLLY